MNVLKLTMTEKELNRVRQPNRKYRGCICTSTNVGQGCCYSEQHLIPKESSGSHEHTAEENYTLMEEYRGIDSLPTLFMLHLDIIHLSSVTAHC
jgi:hypothetical protein